jgi:hypothetical protein
MQCDQLKSDKNPKREKYKCGIDKTELQSADLTKFCETDKYDKCLKYQKAKEKQAMEKPVNVKQVKVKKLKKL